MSKADLSTILFRIGKPFETFAILNFNSLKITYMALFKKSPHALPEPMSAIGKNWNRMSVIFR